MKSFITGIDPLRILVLMLMLLPFLATLGFGVLWMWQHGYLVYWLLAMVILGGLSYGLQQILMRRERKLLAEAATEPNPDWPPSAGEAWQLVESLAQTCNPEDWPLGEEAWIFSLGQRTLETVARSYHPDAEQPVLELTLPHTLFIIERASRDLRKDVAEKIPFSHRLTIGNVLRMQRWKDSASSAFDIYRAGRAIVNPSSALLSETWRLFREKSMDQALHELHRWLLRAYVRKVGYYAIELYSRRLPLLDDEEITSQTAASKADRKHISATSNADEEPLRILVLGRMNAGKSSLINALFGELTVITDVLPDTTQLLKPFALSRQGLTQAMIFDTPGFDSDSFGPKEICAAAENADLILWVSPVNRPDRQSERECLDQLRTFQSDQAKNHQPPLIVVASHIDLLRPAKEWQPPYDLVHPYGTKSLNIRAAVEAIAHELAVPIDHVIPACLLQGQVYNVDDVLWSAILNRQDAALRTRLLRCLHERKRREDWDMLRRQLSGAGRFLYDLPGKFRKSKNRS